MTLEDIYEKLNTAFYRAVFGEAVRETFGEHYRGYGIENTAIYIPAHERVIYLAATAFNLDPPVETNHVIAYHKVRERDYSDYQPVHELEVQTIAANVALSLKAVIDRLYFAPELEKDIFTGKPAVRRKQAGAPPEKTSVLPAVVHVEKPKKRKRGPLDAL